MNGPMLFTGLGCGAASALLLKGRRGRCGAERGQRAGVGPRQLVEILKQ